MEKRTYYVAVGSGDILEEKGAASFEFEIEATPEEIRELETLFEEREREDLAAFVRAHIPIMLYHKDGPNDDYDEDLREIYRKIYELGTPETKRHMEQLGILNWDPSY